MSGTRKSVRMDRLVEHKNELSGDILKGNSDLAASVREDMVPLEKEFMVKVILPYTANGGDELTINKGDIIHVKYSSKEEMDEWFYGTNKTTGDFGLFPFSNCETKEQKKHRKSLMEDKESVHHLQDRLDKLENLVSVLELNVQSMPSKPNSSNVAVNSESNDLKSKIREIEDKLEGVLARLDQVEEQKGKFCC